MEKNLPLISIFAALTTLMASAQDGGQLYDQYCSACHGQDGKGAGEGVFPPLAGSNWLEGNPKRALAIILHGLEGPIEVSGKPYNLAMPPQGGTLDDKSITLILNYVNSSWGNANPKVNFDVVRVLRSEFEKRDKPWTAPELLELYPLPKIETPLKDLLSTVYRGQWKSLPDFSKLKAQSTEEEHNGIIDITVAGLKKHYGIVWTADFFAHEDGEYQFSIKADDGARILINDKVVATLKGSGPMSPKRIARGSIKLKTGKNPIRIEYFNSLGEQGLEIQWRKRGSGEWEYLTKRTKPRRTHPQIMLAPKDSRPVIYRNFIRGTTARAIGFGFPGNLNLAYSADNLAPELIWDGKFIDAGLHWTNRGIGSQPPAGKTVLKLSGRRFLPDEATFKGYTLDSSGNPTFRVKIGEQLLTDSWKPGEAGTFVRTLTLQGGTTGMDIPRGNMNDGPSKIITLKPGVTEEVIYKLK